MRFCLIVHNRPNFPRRALSGHARGAAGLFWGIGGGDYRGPGRPKLQIKKPALVLTRAGFK